MKVQTRLSIFCSITFGIIFAIISTLIYGLYSKNAENSIYKGLEKNAYISALFYLEEDELNSTDFEKIRIQFQELVSNSSFQIYNSQDEVAYGVHFTNISSPILNKIRQQGSLSFSTSDYFCHGIFYEDNQGDFVIVATEKKDILRDQMSLLLWILIASFFIGFVAIVFFSTWMSRIAYRPFSNVIKQVKKISTNNLTTPIQSPNTKDELQNLTDTFNDLLLKISDTFVIQKNFVSYVSHEFKTPLASMQGNLEVFSLKDRSPEEYKELSGKLIRQISELEEILNTLLVISDLSKNADISIQTRIDELVWEIVEKILFRYPKSKVIVDIQIQPEDENLMYINKDRTQILMALYNLIENAVKYSSGKNVDIDLHKRNEKLHISITDQGIGIPEDQLTDISRPFYRAENTNKIQGSGLGLSIALRILEKNDIEYRIESKVDIGTKVSLIF